MSTYPAPSELPAATKVPMEFLLDYASGAAPEPVALAVATMLDMNPVDASVYHQLNAIGGALLEALPAGDAGKEDAALVRMMGRLENAPQDPLVCQRAAPVSIVPLPLQPYVGASLDHLRWNSVAPGVEEYVLRTSAPGYRTSLLRIAPGKAMPMHRHGGLEMTVVLDGAYADCNGHFARRRCGSVVLLAGLSIRSCGCEDEICFARSALRGIACSSRGARLRWSQPGV
jgi:putative transcriptional regulator